MAEINKIAESLFEKIRDRFDDVSLGDDKAKATQNPEDARFFNFDYDVDGKTHGNITISIIDGQALKVYFSTSITNNLDEDEKNKWYSFLRELREFAKRNLLSFEPRDITRNTLKHRDLQHVSKADSTYDKNDIALGESKMYGTLNRSYQKFGPARIVVQHTKPVVDEAHGARARNINAIFVENDQGERFRLPFKNLSGARAMARHISAGGTVYDDIGKHITGIVEECNKLRPFLRNVRTRTFEDAETAEMCNSASEYYNELHKQLNQLKGKRGYTAFKESFVADNTLMDDTDVDSLKNRFVRQVYDDRIDEALPIVNKAHKMKTSSKLAAQFESWANQIVENGDTLINIENSDKLLDLFNKPLTVGVDGINAIAAIEGLIGDDNLVNALTALATHDAEADARQTIADWVADNDPYLHNELFGDEGADFENEVDEAWQPARTSGINWPKEVPTDSGFPGEESHLDDDEFDPTNPMHFDMDDDEDDRPLWAKRGTGKLGESDEAFYIVTNQGEKTWGPGSELEAHNKLEHIIKNAIGDEANGLRVTNKIEPIEESNDDEFDYYDDNYGDQLQAHGKEIKKQQEIDAQQQWDKYVNQQTKNKQLGESEEPNSKLQSYIGKQVYVKTAGTTGKVIQISPTHRNSLVIALDNGQQTVAHFTDVSDEKPGTIRHVLDKFNALTGGNPSKSPVRTQRAAPSTQSRDFAESDDNEPDYCPACDGTGEGQYDGTKCSRCGGSGVLKDKSEDDGPEYEKFNETIEQMKRIAGL